MPQLKLYLSILWPDQVLANSLSLVVLHRLDRVTDCFCQPAEPVLHLGESNRAANQYLRPVPF